jgi:hypothetical protein
VKQGNAIAVLKEYSYESEISVISWPYKCDEESCSSRSDVGEKDVLLSISTAQSRITGIC